MIGNAFARVTLHATSLAFGSVGTVHVYATLYLGPRQLFEALLLYIVATALLKTKELF